MFVVYIHMCYWFSVGSRWLNIGQVLLYIFIRRGQQKRKKERANIHVKAS